MPRHKVPVAIKALRGTQRVARDGVSRAAVAVPGELSHAELPPPPEWLTDREAVAEWHQAGGTLAACGVLRDSALTTLAHYCATHAALVNVWRSGGMPDPAVLSQLRLLAGSLQLVGPRSVGEPPKAPNRFEKFRRQPDD